MVGERAQAQLLARARPLLALADALEAAAAQEDEAAALAQAADTADAELLPSRAQHNGAVRALQAEARSLWRAEAAKLRRRCRALCVHGANALAANKALLERLYAQLDARLGARVRAELEAVGALVQLMRAAVESEAQLSHALELADGAALVVDESLLLVPRRPAMPAPAPRQRLGQLRLSVAQLVGLSARFGSEATGSTLPLRTAIDVLLRAAAAGELPPLWRQFERTVLLQVCRLFPSAHAAQVSWHALVLALAQLPAPTSAQLAALAEACERNATPGEHGGLTRSSWDELELWFGPQPAREGEVAREFDVEAVRAASAPSPYPAHTRVHAHAEILRARRNNPLPSQALKAALFDALATRHANGASRLNQQRFVLYTCDSVPKAFAATAFADHGAVSAAELHALLHRDELPLPEHPPAELTPNPDPFSLAVVHRLFAELNCDAGKDRVPYLMVANNPLGARILSACELYRVNNVYAVLEAKLAAVGDLAIDM
ncbi:hypothetical protein T492DRAFT_1151730 [Pavlovales sp. CCMP2436]|nr:hypothetical protein T492DRAFT_1151730 [Pavlovales sp. CCMP2436]